MDFPATSATLDTLPNGLSLILDPDHDAPVVSAQLWVETGSIHEGSWLGSGLSHFLEHMVFKGAGNYGPSELAETVQAAGGHWNAYTSFDRTVYYIDGPSTGLGDFLRVLSAMVFHPHLPKSEFEKEKDVIRREIDMGLDDPDDRNHQLLFSTAFVRDPRRHPVIGHRHLFDAIPYDELKRYHEERYTPDHCCLCISGDFDADAIRETINSLMGDLPRSKGNEPAVAHDSAQLGPRQARDTFAVPASRISLTWKIPSLDDPIVPALDLAAIMLGRGRAAHLYRKLRQDNELALDISAWCWSNSEREGLFGVSAEAEVENRDALIDAIREEILAFSQSPIEDDLARAKRQLAASQFRTLTTASGRATDLASNWHEARDINFTRSYLAKLESVTAAEIRSALNQLCSIKETLTTLDPEGTAAPKKEKRKTLAAKDVEAFTLANGATVALLPNPKVPILAVNAAVRGGASSETLATAGVNRLLASTLPQGTRSHSPEELADTLESLGASIGASSGNNSIMVKLAGLTPDFATLMPIFGEILAEPSLPGEAIERERASQLAALRETLTDPLSVAFRQLRRNLFSDTGYGVPSLGEEESLTNIHRLGLAAHHSCHFRGPNIAVAVAGDFDVNEARDILSAALDSLPGGDAWHPSPTNVLEPSDQVYHLAKKQAVLTFGYPGAAALDEDHYALRYLQEWCSDMAGPLFMRLREDLGLAYQVGATQFHGHDTGMFAFYIATNPAQAELAEEEMRSQIAQLATDGIPADAFERVRSTVLSAHALEQQSAAAISRNAAIDILFGLPATHHRETYSILSQITQETVRKAACKMLAHRQPVISRVMPES